MQTVQYSIPYLLFTLVESLLLSEVSIAYNNYEVNREKNLKFTLPYIINVLLSLSILILFSSLRKTGLYSTRWLGGTDNIIYNNVFNGAYKVNYFEYIKKYLSINNFIEPIFVSVLWVIRQFTSSYNIVLAICNMSMGLCLLRINKIFYIPRKYLWVNFGIVLIYLEGFNTLRNVWAMLLSIYFIDSIYRNSIKKAIFSIVVCCGVHISGLVLIPILLIYEITRREDNRLKNLLILYSFYVAGLTGIVLYLRGHLIGRYSQYINEGNYSLSHIILAIGISILYVMFFSPSKQQDSYENDKLLYIALCYIWAISPMLIMQLFSTIFYRFIMWLMPVAYLVLMEYIKRTRKENILHVILSIAVIMTLFIKITGFCNDEIPYIGAPYTTIFSDSTYVYTTINK